MAELASGMRVGIVHGYEYPPFVAQLARHGIIVETARSDVANLRKLSAGRIDLALVMSDAMRSEDLVQRQAGVKNIALAFNSTPMESFIGCAAPNTVPSEPRPRFCSTKLLRNVCTRSRLRPARRVA